MSSTLGDLGKIADVFFNGRRFEGGADESRRSTVTIQELVARGTSVVRVGKKLYRITCKEVEISK